MRITVNNVGDIEEAFKALVSSMEVEMMKAMDTSVASLQGVLRFDTNTAGLGAGISGAWQKKLYPREYGSKSMEPVGLVYSKAPKIIYALSTGAIITAKKHVWLAIPLPTAGIGPVIRGNVRARMSPAIFESMTGIELQFVSIHGGSEALLVAAGRLSSKKNRRFGPDFRNAGSITKQQFNAFARYGGTVTAVAQRRTRTGARAKTGLTSIPVFLLVRSVRAPKLFDLEKRADEAQRYLAASVATGLAVAVVPKLGKV